MVDRALARAQAKAKPLAWQAPHNGALGHAMLAKLAVDARLRYGPRHLFSRQGRFSRCLSRTPKQRLTHPMKISGVDIRPGNILEYEGGIWKVAKIQHTQPGKGGAYMQVEMKNLIDGRKTNVRFRSADTVEKVRLDTKDYQFLYEDGDQLVFMDKDTYEQINLPSDLLGDARPFLQDGMEVMLELWDERPISVELPNQVEATIVEADAVVKGQTASSSYKPAILDNGVRIMVPPHIGSGTRIIVDVYEQAYVGKAG
jgi:elongation factor P